MRALLFCLTFWALVWAHTASAQSSNDDLDQFLDVAHQQSGVPGLTYAVVEGERVRTGMRGRIPTASGSSGDVDTPFSIGSISKSFTALAVMMLVESGDIDLDREVGAYLPSLANQASGRATIRQLLSHTSGFSTRQGNDSMSALGLPEPTLAAALERLSRWEPDHEAGEVWAYSNANYLVLGALIEGVSGQAFGDYIQLEILTPLEMNNSFVADGARHDAVALGHQPWFGSKRIMEPGHSEHISAPAGGVVSTAGDLARYLSVMMNGQDDIVSAATKAAMMEPASEVSWFYGLGWHVDASQGAVYHSGLVPGAEALAVLMPDQGRAALILVNANGGFGFGESGYLLPAFTSQALGLEPVSPGGAWGRKSLVLIFVLSPLLFVLGIVQAVRGRAMLRAKSGLVGVFSLWFPVVMTLGLAFVTLELIPGFFGTSLGTLNQYQPDLVLVFVATAITGLAWSLGRIIIAYAPRLSGSTAT